jgi:hypothetical protein
VTRPGIIGSSVRAPQRWHNVSAKADNGVPSGEARMPSMAHTPVHSYNPIAPPKCESWAENQTSASLKGVMSVRLRPRRRVPRFPAERKCLSADTPSTRCIRRPRDRHPRWPRCAASLTPQSDGFDRRAGRQRRSGDTRLQHLGVQRAIRWLLDGVRLPSSPQTNPPCLPRPPAAAPRVNQSGDKDRRGPLTKHGPT